MMVIRKLLLVIMLSILIVTNILATSKRLVPIDIDYSDDDTVGNLLVYKIKEKIQNSTDKYIVRPGSDIYPKVSLIIMTLVYDKDRSNDRSVYNVIYTLETSLGVRLFYTAIVGHCGIQKVNDVADLIVNDLNSYIESMIIMGENGWWPFDPNTWNI